MPCSPSRRTARSTWRHTVDGDQLQPVGLRARLAGHHRLLALQVAQVPDALKRPPAMMWADPPMYRNREDVVRESTSRWLEPMLLEADLREVDVGALMSRATVPAAKAASYMPEGAAARAIDWIRFGRLLREKLGWEDYPGFPEEAS